MDETFRLRIYNKLHSIDESGDACIPSLTERCISAIFFGDADTYWIIAGWCLSYQAFMSIPLWPFSLRNALSQWSVLRADSRCPKVLQHVRKARLFHRNVWCLLLDSGRFLFWPISMSMSHCLCFQEPNNRPVEHTSWLVMNYQKFSLTQCAWRIIPVSKWLITMVNKPLK